jgi:hypothetical protein
MESHERWSIRSVDQAEACGGALYQEIEGLALPVMRAWLAYYRTLEEALLTGDYAHIVQLQSERPSDSLLAGHDFLNRAHEHQHEYARWLRRNHDKATVAGTLIVNDERRPPWAPTCLSGRHDVRELRCGCSSPA